MIFQQDFRNLVGIRFLKLIPTNLSSIIRHFECFYVVQRNKNVSKSRLAINLTSSRYTFCYTSLRVRSVSRSHSAKSTRTDVKFINRTQVYRFSWVWSFRKSIPIRFQNRIGMKNISILIICFQLINLPLQHAHCAFFFLTKNLAQIILLRQLLTL